MWTVVHAKQKKIAIAIKLLSTVHHFVQGRHRCIGELWLVDVNEVLDRAPARAWASNRKGSRQQIVLAVFLTHETRVVSLLSVVEQTLVLFHRQDAKNAKFLYFFFASLAALR